MRRIRIVGAGLDPIHGWQVLDAETGEMIAGVVRVEVVVDPQEGVSATLHLHEQLELDLQVEADEQRA